MKNEKGITYDPVKKEYKVEINKEVVNQHSVLPNYPAVIISLSNNEFIKVKPDYIGQEPNSYSEEVFENLKCSDLWIEPRDPEIGIPPYGKGKLKVVNEKWGKINSSITKKYSVDLNGLRRSEIKKGTVFLFKKNSGALYKVRIDAFNKEKEEMSLTYKLID